MKLISIEEHNERALFLHGNKNLTGVECPSCGEELQYVDRHIVLTSYPPQYQVKCFSCGYTGKIF